MVVGRGPLKSLPVISKTRMKPGVDILRNFLEKWQNKFALKVRYLLAWWIYLIINIFLLLKLSLNNINTEKSKIQTFNITQFILSIQSNFIEWRQVLPSWHKTHPCDTIDCQKWRNNTSEITNKYKYSHFYKMSFLSIGQKCTVLRQFMDNLSDFTIGKLMFLAQELEKADLLDVDIQCNESSKIKIEKKNGFLEASCEHGATMVQGMDDNSKKSNKRTFYNICAGPLSFDLPKVLSIIETNLKKMDLKQLQNLIKFQNVFNAENADCVNETPLFFKFNFEAIGISNVTFGNVLKFFETKLTLPSTDNIYDLEPNTIRLTTRGKHTKDIQVVLHVYYCNSNRIETARAFQKRITDAFKPVHVTSFYDENNENVFVVIGICDANQSDELKQFADLEGFVKTGTELEKHFWSTVVCTRYLRKHEQHLFNSGTTNTKVDLANLAKDKFLALMCLFLKHNCKEQYAKYIEQYGSQLNKLFYRIRDGMHLPKHREFSTSQYCRPKWSHQDSTTSN
eukprot:NODE_320_length_9849_cov_0.608923.p2 type:complete len:510 gc:universal NODE_320_length_9849_cov_0.608923:4218-5747(+)